MNSAADTQMQEQALTAPTAVGAEGLIEQTNHDFELRFCYRIGRLEFVLEKTLITEILLKPVIYTIPNGPAWLSGMINQRGNIIPVFDLSAVLVTDLKSNPGEFVLVVDRGSEAMAILVDGLPRALPNPEPMASLCEPNLNLPEFVLPGVSTADGLAWNQLEVKALVEHLVSQETAGHFKSK